MFAVSSGSTRRRLHSFCAPLQSTRPISPSLSLTVGHWMPSLSASRNLIPESRKQLRGHLVILHVTTPVKYTYHASNLISQCMILHNSFAPKT